MVTFLLAIFCLGCLSIIIHRKDYKMPNLNVVPFQLLDFSRVHLSFFMLVNQLRTRLKGVPVVDTFIAYTVSILSFLLPNLV